MEEVHTDIVAAWASDKVAVTEKRLTRLAFAAQSQEDSPIVASIAAVAACMTAGCGIDLEVAERRAAE